MHDSAADDEVKALLTRFEMPLLHYATRIIGDRERARDVVQETFVRWQRNGTHQTDNAPAKWLFTVCRNRALNVCRKERRLTLLDDSVIASHPAEAPLPIERLEQKEAAGFLLRILATLPPRQQEVLQLKFRTISAINRSPRSRTRLQTTSAC